MQTIQLQSSNSKILTYVKKSISRNYKLIPSINTIGTQIRLNLLMMIDTLAT